MAAKTTGKTAARKATGRAKKVGSKKPVPKRADAQPAAGANVQQLEQAGLTPDHIHHVADCTMCRADLYHSYRREGKGAGRMISFVGFAK